MPANNFNRGYSVIGDISKLKLSDKATFGGNVLFIVNEEVKIGDYSMVATNVIFHTSTHDYLSHPMWEYRIDRPIYVGQHVWIGTGAIILPGVIIEDYSVIAAGSVVNSNVPKGAIVGGNPARILKYRDKEPYEKEMTITDSNLAHIIKSGYLEKVAKSK